MIFLKDIEPSRGSDFALDHWSKIENLIINLGGQPSLGSYQEDIEFLLKNDIKLCLCKDGRSIDVVSDITRDNLYSGSFLALEFESKEHELMFKLTYL